MNQTYEDVKEMKSLEVEEIEYPEVQKSMESKVDELLGDLNPGYFEEVIPLNEAKERIYSSKSYSNFSFNPYGF
jgi:hypothetical protein